MPGNLRRQHRVEPRHIPPTGTIVELATTTGHEEHHASDFGWSCNPVMEGGMILADTSRVRVGVAAALGPLWKPTRLAEDLAVVDQFSHGRIAVTLGLGYRPIKYAALGRDYSRRGKLMDELLDILLKAWSAEPLDYHGRQFGSPRCR